MPKTATDDLILAALEDYAADLDTTFSPESFVKWVREHRPHILESVGEANLAAFASELIASAGAPRR